MGKFSGLAVETDGPERPYYPGQTISGKVKLDLEKPLTAVKLIVTLRGVAHVKWTPFGRQAFEDTKTYVDRQVDLWNKTGTGKSSTQATMAMGNHAFPFSFQLPHPLPSSYVCKKEKKLYIRYTIKAKIVRKWKEDYTDTKPFTVLEYVDVNQPQFLVPVKKENQAMLGALFFKNGPVILRGNVDRKAYCPGESVLVTASMENHSKKTLVGITATINENRTLLADGATHKTSRVIATAVVDDATRVGPGESHDFVEAKALEIPQTAPTIAACALLKLEHAVELKVNGIDLAVSIPIVLGCVPLRKAPARAPLPPQGAPPPPSIQRYNSASYPSYQQPPPLGQQYNSLPRQLSLGQTPYPPQYSSNPQYPSPSSPSSYYPVAAAPSAPSFDDAATPELYVPMTEIEPSSAPLASAPPPPPEENLYAEASERGSSAPTEDTAAAAAAEDLYMPMYPFAKN